MSRGSRRTPHDDLRRAIAAPLRKTHFGKDDTLLRLERRRLAAEISPPSPPGYGGQLSLATRAKAGAVEGIELKL
jgi:hypothetical protein